MCPFPNAVGPGICSLQIAVAFGQRETNGQPRLSCVHSGMSVARRAFPVAIFRAGLGTDSINSCV